VDCLKDLADSLDLAGLLRPFLVQSPLDPADADTVNVRLCRLKDVEHRYTDARDLATRVQACGFGLGVSAQRRRDVQRNIIDLCRHLGHYEQAEQLSREEAELVRASAVSSYDDQAQADVNLAAALYDPHRFQESVAILSPWCERLQADPRLVGAATRVMVFNTSARAQVISGGPGWEELIHRSADILRQWDPSDLPRTWSYLAHGLLRNGRLKEAWDVICQIEDHTGLDQRSRWSLRFLQAEHARQRKEQWISEEMEITPEKWPGAGHPIGFYLQATARQFGRDSEDSAERFRLASSFFLRDALNPGSPYILHFLADCMRLGEAAWGHDIPLWNGAVEAVAVRLRPGPPSRLDEYYADAFNALGPSPDRVVVDAFLSRVPFF
jgi:pentatricopeptide repeat protein